MLKSLVSVRGHRGLHIYSVAGATLSFSALTKSELLARSIQRRQIKIFTFAIPHFHRQKRGINISLDCVTNLFEGQSIKAKFWNRRGFSKAFAEMEDCMSHSQWQTQNDVIRGAIECAAKNKKKSLDIVVRRSPRLNKPEIVLGLRRSERLAKKK